ncbi:transposase [Borreliella afzelii]
MNKFNYDKNHIHLLLEFTPNIQTSKLINNLKTASLGAYKKIFYLFK